MSARTFISLVVAALVLSPALAAAQQVSIPAVSATSQNGIFSCNQTGSYAMSVGALGATGGTYVPVYDNSVTLNTGYLVYLECVLRPAVTAAAHAVTATLTTQELSQFLTANNNNPAFTGSGNPFFVQNFGLEASNVANKAFNGTLSGVTGSLNSAFQSQIASALARNYAMTTNNPSLALSCPYSNIGSVYSNSTFSWAGIFALGNPTCDPVFAYNLAQAQVNANVAAAQNAWLTQLNWGNGIYPAYGANGQVVTPGSLVGFLAGQALVSGQLTEQNANDIGQMFTNGLIPALASQILNLANNGLAGLNTSNGTTPSYLQQAAASAGQQLGQEFGNVGAINAQGLIGAQEAYLSAEENEAGYITQAVDTLNSQQNACWNYILQYACPSGLTYQNGTATCTDSAGSQLTHIATSTPYAQTAINDTSSGASVAQLGMAVAQQASTTQAAITELQNWGTEAQSTDPTTQQNALNSIQDFSPPSGSSADDATNVQTFLGVAPGATTGFLQTTINGWFGNLGQTDANGNPVYQAWDGKAGDPTGWCNVPQQSGQTPSTAQQQTINGWITQWQ